jgi:hypothetical protein
VKICTKQDQLLDFFFSWNSKLLLAVVESLSGHRPDRCGSNPSELETSFFPHHLKTCFAIRPVSYPVKYIPTANFLWIKRSDIQAGHSPRVWISFNVSCTSVLRLHTPWCGASIQGNYRLVLTCRFISHVHCRMLILCLISHSNETNLVQCAGCL